MVWAKISKITGRLCGQEPEHLPCMRGAYRLRYVKHSTWIPASHLECSNGQVYHMYAHKHINTKHNCSSIIIRLSCSMIGRFDLTNNTFPYSQTIPNRYSIHSRKLGSTPHGPWNCCRTGSGDSASPTDSSHAAAWSPAFEPDFGTKPSWIEAAIGLQMVKWCPMMSNVHLQQYHWLSWFM